VERSDDSATFRQILEPSMNRRTFLRQSGAAALGLYASRLGGLQVSAPAPRSGAAKKVAILGAGISGLAAGLELVKAGHDVTILEAQLRPGGRVYTLRAPFSDGLYAEAGAGRIPETHYITLDYVKRFKLELEPFFPQSGTGVFLWRGKRQLVPHGKEPELTNLDVNFTPEERKVGFRGLATKYLGSLQDKLSGLPQDAWPPASLPELGDISLRDYLRQQGASTDAIQYISEGFEGDALLDFIHDSVSHLPMLWKIRGGNDRLPHAMADALHGNIRYGANVVRIVQKENLVEMTYKNAGSHFQLTADRVICTIPYTVLRGIEVQPQWSANKAFAIHNLYMGPVARVYAQTRNRFWEADGRNGFAEVDQPMEIWSPTHHEPGARGIVMSYAYEDLAVRYSAMNEEAQMQQSLDLFEQVHPGLRENFEGGTTWSWLNHPYSKGAFTVVKPGQFRGVVPYVAIPEGRIHFAGEHTSPWTGWIQGALHSGLRTAREVMTTA
jgi:monoamine oxidase